MFGVGAESRNNPITIPPGYGYLVTPDTRWFANIHLLRTEGLAGDNAAKAAKECNECYYAPGKGCTPEQNGSFFCCGEGDFAGVTSCPTAANAPPARDYVLRYTVRYTRSLDALTPLQIGTITAPACLPYYEVHRNESHPEHRVDNSMRIPASAGPIDVRFAAGHLHTGGINISIVVNGRVACTSYPRYGTQPGVAGDEKGYLVQMSHCVNGSTGPIHLQPGDELGVSAAWCRPG